MINDTEAKMDARCRKPRLASEKPRKYHLLVQVRLEFGTRYMLRVL